LSVYFFVMNKTIYFWDTKDENGWLSNFYPSEIIYMDKKYPTSEHLYQALKFSRLSNPIHEEIRNATSPKKAKNIAHSNKKNYGHDTIEKSSIMRMAIKHKFNQNNELKEKLINSKGKIVENSPTDYFWGIGKNKNGLNLMGLLLMELRTELQGTE